MKKFFILLLVSILTAFVVLMMMDKPGGIPVISQVKPEITIGGKQVTVEVAKTDAQKELGLGGRTTLADDQGMLFEFPEANRIPGFWMKGMVMSIDIIWIKDNKVVFIHKNVGPQPDTQDNQLTVYAPPIAVEDVDYVLETRAGFSDQYKVEVDTLVDLSKLF